MNEIEEEIRRRMIAEQAAVNTLPPPPPPPAARKQGTLQRWQSQGGLTGAIAAILIVLAKFGAPILALLAKLKGALVLFKFAYLTKFLITGGSMLLSIVVEAFQWGLPMAIGITILIFVHESGHAWAAHKKGIGWSFMLFIPFFGAMVSTKRYGKSLEEDAYIGIMGPVAGTLGGIACFIMFLATRSIFWLFLARINFMINLFNLLPTPPLDGGWITPVFSPKLLALGVVLLFVVGIHNPMIWMLAFMSLPRIISHWKANPATMPYYQVSKRTRITYAVAYLGLAAFLGLSVLWTTAWIHEVLTGVSIIA